MDEFSVFGREPSSSGAFAPQPEPATRRDAPGADDSGELHPTYVTAIAQTPLVSAVGVGSAHASVAVPHSASGPRLTSRHPREPVVGVAEEPSGTATPVQSLITDEPHPIPVKMTHAQSPLDSLGGSPSRDSSSGSAPRTDVFGSVGSSGASPKMAAAASSPGIIHTSPLCLTAAPRVKGAIEPQRLTVSRKAQLVVAPTGGSDSESGSMTSHGSHSPSVEESESEDEAEEQRFVDEFGFVIDEDQKEADEKFIRKIDGKQVKRREVKWAHMTTDWSRTNTKMHAKVKERCRKGIPSRMRGAAWQLLCNSRAQMDAEENAGVYLALREKRLSDQEIDAIISRDLARTFPKHILFKDQGGVGQTFLRNVLHAYAGIDPEVGYVQGMAFLVGALSTQMGEEESFWALHEMMYNERYKMREMFCPGFPLLQQFFYQFKRLLARLLPKLSRHFEAMSVEPSFYASQWFMTLFVYHFPFRALLRVWDVFFSEGWKIVFRVGLALLQWEEKRLLAMSFEDVLTALKTLQDGKDSKELLRRAHRIKFKTAELNRYGEEYWQSVGQASP